MSKKASQSRFVSQPPDFNGGGQEEVVKRQIPLALVRIQAGPVIQINELDFLRRHVMADKKGASHAIGYRERYRTHPRFPSGDEGMVAHDRILPD
jgi:hypothetical protein